MYCCCDIISGRQQSYFRRFNWERKILQKINLFEIAYLSREKVNLFKSDFRIVADYFVQMRETGNYTGNKENITHVQELLSLMSVMTGDNRFEETLNCENETEAKPKNMCEVLDRIEQRGFRNGEAHGMIQVSKVIF